MSLTSFLENSRDFRAFLRHTFPRTRIVASTPLLVPCSVPNASWIGTGFDYLLRWTLQSRYPTFVERGPWIAEQVHGLLRSKRSRLARAVRERLSSARRRLARFRRTHSLTDGLCASAIELAQIDPLFRVGAGAEYVTAPVPSGYVAEVRRLIEVVPLREFKPKSLGLLNPVFGASRLVLGADADLIVDDMLIEVKTSKHCTIAREQFNQLLGYYLLVLLGGVRGAPRNHRIRKLAIYQSRQGRLVVWRVRDLGTASQFADAAKLLEQRAREVFDWPPDVDWRRPVPPVEVRRVLRRSVRM